MEIWKVEYSQTSREHARSLEPSIKPIVKKRIEQIRENPFIGKPLERELSGYYSYRVKRFRILFKIDANSKIVQIHYIGHRKDVYELLREIVGSRK
jgi:mRNA interferase RelE/StbE